MKFYKFSTKTFAEKARSLLGATNIFGMPY